MSRSFKKKNFRWLGCNSEKDYKQEYHRRFRRVFNQLLHCGEDENFPHKNKYYDSYCCPSDGKFMMDNYWIHETLEDDPDYIIKRYKKDSLGRWHMMK